MSREKLPMKPGTLLRMEWGTDGLYDDVHQHAGLGAGADGGFLVTALGRGRILAPTYGGSLRPYSGITFWKPGATRWARPYGDRTEGYCSATFRGDNESWFYVEVVQ